jgi:hypothetical protein
MAEIAMDDGKLGMGRSHDQRRGSITRLTDVVVAFVVTLYSFVVDKKLLCSTVMEE